MDVQSQIRRACPVLVLSVMAACALSASASLDAVLEPIRQANDLPALAAAVVKGGQTVAVGAVGVRKAGSPQRVTADDKWHIGSCTKSMTAALAAMLVEDGTLRWDMTPAEMFADLESQMQPEWREVTLEQLLAHRGGAPPDLDEQGLWDRLWQRADRLPREQREYLTRELLTMHEPVAPPGVKTIYSNAGYALVGHAIESLLDRPWEDLLRQRLFAPLGMTGAGFGAPASVGEVDQPWGHKAGEGGTFEPVAPGLHADNPAAIGPGGTVHCRLDDLAKYAAWHLAGARGERARHASPLLHPETFERLHTPLAADSEYALGWVATERPWGGGTVLTHAGSNTMFYAVIWIAPQKDFAVVVCTNAGGDAAEKAVDHAAAILIREGTE
ncbi:serine hydrolase domain-containing protein [Anaerobaca lacustris]|uniref:Serine hydrolase domain-containing protein n=1 Tax=Anaerobaca lacustris TaxID=3044600 RepID=A0AAW6U0J1_9BACT|nr:serine hydrolase domain-containing protein [Sedimentisphaerales bacterium M17dextr]